jgi:hypothetical protein
MSSVEGAWQDVRMKMPFLSRYVGLILSVVILAGCSSGSAPAQLSPTSPPPPSQSLLVPTSAPPPTAAPKPFDMAMSDVLARPTLARGYLTTPN